MPLQGTVKRKVKSLGAAVGLHHRVIRVTVDVTPIGRVNLTEVSNLVRDLLVESCGGDATDTFKDVQLVNAFEDTV